jgi:GcrA cell cycle regulator
MIWTDEKMDMLKKMWQDGSSASEIAMVLGDVSRNAVIGKAHRLMLKGRASPIKRKEQNKNRSFAMLNERMCKWPFGDPKKSDFHFCGEPREFADSYCDVHKVAAYAPSRKVAAGAVVGAGK